MDEVFRALAHDARRAMLRRLAGGELTVGELAQPLDMSLAAASKHVQMLERAGAGAPHRGRPPSCVPARAAPLAQAEAWLRWYEPFWNDRLDALAHLFREGGPGLRPPNFP